MADAALQRRDEAVVGLDLQRADDAARHDEAEGVDRIGRVRAQDHVARRGDRLRHVGEAFLGAERRDDLRFGIELHAEAAGVVAGLGAAQAGNAARGRIAMRARVAHHFAQLVDDRLGRRQVGIAHAEIDDVGAARAGAGLQPVDLLEDVGRKPADLVKFFHVNPGGWSGLFAWRDIYRFAAAVDRCRSRCALDRPSSVSASIFFSASSACSAASLRSSTGRSRLAGWPRRRAAGRPRQRRRAWRPFLGRDLRRSRPVGTMFRLGKVPVSFGVAGRRSPAHGRPRSLRRLGTAQALPRRAAVSRGQPDSAAPERTNDHAGPPMK